MKCSFVLSQGKAASLAASASELLQADLTPQDGVKWKGVLGLNAWIGAPDKEGWDRPKQLSAAARDELEFGAGNLVEMAGHTKPMWRLSPQELLRQFKAGEKVIDATISTDASWMGWGAVLEILQEDGGRSIMKTSGRWGTSDEAGEQEHRESCGTLQALETFVQEMQGKIVLHLTDCTP
eukprot:1847678-Rhodomonas_salina.1